MDADSLHLALEEKELYGGILEEKMQSWKVLGSEDADNTFAADARSSFIPIICCAKHRKTRWERA